jgi:hypothetical protein
MKPNKTEILIGILLLCLMLTFFSFRGSENKWQSKVSLLNNELKKISIEKNTFTNNINDSKTSDKKLENYLEFSLYNLDYEKLRSIEPQPNAYTIHGISQIIYVDLNGDGTSEAIVELDTDPYGGRDFFYELLSKIINRAHAGGVTPVNIFGVFAFDEDTKKWSPLFIDSVGIAIYGCEGGMDCSIDPKKINDIPVFLDIKILNKAYGEKKVKPVKTEILVQKKYCLEENGSCEYKLHFTDLEFTQEKIK